MRTVSSDLVSASGRISSERGKKGKGLDRPAHTREREEFLGHYCLLFSEAGARVFIELADVITRQVRYE